MANSSELVKHVFAVGTPGAGKTTFCQVLEDSLARVNLRTNRIGDYPYLQSLFASDMKQGVTGRFKEDPEAQFEVLDPRVYDEALKAIYDEELSQPNDDSGDLISVIEFSRPTYETSFSQYPVHVLASSIVVHIAAPIAICSARNEGRRQALERKLMGALDRNSVFDEDPDLHYVPRAVMNKYYAENERVDRKRLQLQQVTLSLLPFRRYFRLDNSEDDKAACLEKCLDLIEGEILPMLSSTESTLESLLRRFQDIQSLEVDSKRLIRILAASAELSSTNGGASPAAQENGCDVFLAYNSADKPRIDAICKYLKSRGLSPWFDDEQIPPGQPFQDLIQQAIRRARSAAIFIGPGGVGKWEAVELRSLISECVDRKIPVIPVLLPGVSAFPADLTFLSEFSQVSFERHVDEPAGLRRLVWGIKASTAEVPSGSGE